MLMSLTSGFCAKLAGRNQIASGDPIALNSSLHLKRRLTVDPNRKTASCFLAPFRAVGNAFRWTLEKIYIAKLSDEAKAIFPGFSTEDRRNIVAFLKKKDEIVLKVIKDHLATCQGAWPKQQFRSAQSVLKFISRGYTECFLEQFAHFRNCAPDERQHPVEMALFIAHQSAISTVFTNPDLHEDLLPALDQALDKSTGIGAHKQSAQDFVREHRDYYN